MILLDVLRLIGDSEEVNIFNNEYTCIGAYDGKDSINETYNNCIVSAIHAADRNSINIILA